MKTPILKHDELIAIGFKTSGKEILENGDFYVCWIFKKNDSEIDITYEFDANHNFISGYVDFNAEKLAGRELTKKDIKLLIEIM